MRNPRLMLVTKSLEAKPAGGREMLCKLNHDALQSLCGERLHLFELPGGNVRGLRSTLNAFGGYIDGVTVASVEVVLTSIEAQAIDQVFVDGSNLGRLVAAIKRRFPSVEVITFFHNVEARFFWGAFRLSKKPRALAVMVANFLAERLAVRWSEKRICLNERDSRLLKRLYGRGATHIAPMVLEDKFRAQMGCTPAQASEPFALFVGGTFYANRAGIIWYAKQVAPRVNIKVCVVGRGFEALREELEISGKLEVVGPVDDLSDWYARAKFVIAPIFDGSGMKTKVAEALMYGKKIVGTPEAFTGYENVLPQAGWMCKTREEFVSAIVEAQATITQCFDMSLRQIYEQRYSMTAATERLRQILS